MNGVFGFVLARDFTALVRGVFLGAMPADNLSANLIDPPLTVGIGRCVNVFLTHFESPELGLIGREAHLG
jgi:hypothetical protein